MPHVIVKLWPGASAEQKRRLSDAISRSVEGILGHGPDAVSIGFDEVPPGQWSSQVYEPDIARKWSSLMQKPGYGPGPANPAEN